MADGILVVVSGFSGSGKGTLMKKLLSEYDDYALSVSATTRAPRTGEVEGREYFFKSKEDFEKLIENDELIEYASFCNNYYGTPRDYVLEQRKNGKNVILEIEVQGALKVKEKYPDLKVTMFGVHQQGEEIKKEWITYYQKVKADKLCEIYNNTAIFVCASVNEGFGLTGAESMACGNALASTSYKGVFEYAVDKKNALLSPVNNYVELANNIIKLIEDDELRIKLAEDGSKCIGRYSFEEATKTLEDIFTEGL